MALSAARSAAYLNLVVDAHGVDPSLANPCSTNGQLLPAVGKFLFGISMGELLPLEDVHRGTDPYADAIASICWVGIVLHKGAVIGSHMRAQLVPEPTNG